MSQPLIDFFRGAFDTLNRRLDRIEAGQEEILARLSLIGSRLPTIDQGLTPLGRGYAALQHRLDRTALRQAEVDELRRDLALLRERPEALEAP